MTALIIRRGTVKLSHTLTDGRHQIIDFLQAGDIAIRQTSESRLRGSLEASTDVDVCQIEFGDLEDLCNYSPEINRSVIGASLAQIDRKNSQVLVLGRKRAGERVASFLLDMSERAARRGEPPLSVELPMSRAEIADYLSLTTETVSRAFSQLRERAVVDLPKPHEVLVLDIAALREISDGGSDLSVR